MATTFKHNGNTYTIIEGTDEVQLNLLGSWSQEIYLPKYAIFEDKQFRVVDITPTPKGGYISVNVETDGRRKPKYISRWRETTVNIVGDEIYSFHNDRDILKIHFHDSIRTIGEYAFYKFHKIKTIELPAKLKVVGRYSFRRCMELETLYLPNGLLSIGSYAFADCIHLKSILIPDSVTKIESHAFYNCGNLTKVVIGPGIKSIGEWAFASETGVNLKSVDIYADPFEVMIAPNAFPSTVQVSYHNPNKYKQKNIASSKREELSTLISLLKSFSERKTNTAENNSRIFNNKSNDIEIERLIDAVLVDGIITEKERAVILKKTTAAGYDADEVEIILDARLHEKQVAQKEKQVEKKKPVEKSARKEVSKPENEVTSKVSDDSTVEWSELLWEPIKAEMLRHVKVKMTIPKGRAYVSIQSVANKGKIACGISYGVRESEVYVFMETYQGEEMKEKILAAISKLPSDHPLREAELTQGKKNKNKWGWGIRQRIDKNDSGLVRWCSDKIIPIYTAMEEMVL